MSQFRPAKKRIEVSVGDSVRIIRELQGLGQNQLAQLSGTPPLTLNSRLPKFNAPVVPFSDAASSLPAIRMFTLPIPMATRSRSGMSRSAMGAGSH
jgi:hypothetical protein